MLDDFYDDFSEFDLQIEEFKDSLMRSVKEEYQKEMEKLREENARLQEIKKNWDEKVRELEKEKTNLRIAQRDAEQNAKKERLRGLLDIFTKQAWGFKYDYEYIRDKCDKCDERGYIHYKSPQGRDVKEECDCRKRKIIYSPKEAEVVGFREFNKNIHVSFVYQQNSSNDEYKTTDHIYNGEDFDKIKDYFGMVFLNKDDCQRFCDYMNQKM